MSSKLALLVAAWMACAPLAGAHTPAVSHPAAHARIGSYRILATPRGAGVLVADRWTAVPTAYGLRIALPESGSHVFLVERDEADAVAAVQAASTLVGLGPAATPKASPDKPSNGWLEVQSISFDTPAVAGRTRGARAYRSKAGWTVLLTDVAADAAKTRRMQLATLEAHLRAPGFQPESFAGRTPHALDARRVAEITGFIERARKELGIPGVGIGLVQDGRTVFAGGLGHRIHGRAEPVDADTRFAIGSNTKALTTLMLARLVDAGRIGWDTPATAAMPTFRTGDADTTARIRIRHLLCACTGLPRQDMPNWYEYGTPEDKLAQLARIRPTTPFGESFQYSNQMGAVAGYLGAHVLHPDMPIGAAYDRAMQALVFDPLGMRDTTFDFSAAQTGNFVEPHGEDVAGATAVLAMDTNRAAVPLRPAGGAWSTVNDLLRYIRMELDRGRLPDGSRYIDAAVLAERTRPNVEDGILSHYGMGLSTDYSSGVPVVYHGGGMAGMVSDILWLPEHGVGAVILTNAESGGLLPGAFRRRLLEVLFDGEPRAEAELAASVAAYREQLAAERKRLTLPGDARVLAALAPRYRHPELGLLDVRREGGRVALDFGEWRSHAATWTESDGTAYIRLVSPGFVGAQFRVGRDAQGRRTLAEVARGETYTFVETD